MENIEALNEIRKISNDWKRRNFFHNSIKISFLFWYNNVNIFKVEFEQKYLFFNSTNFYSIFTNFCHNWKSNRLVMWRKPRKWSTLFYNGTSNIPTNALPFQLNWKTEMKRISCWRKTPIMFSWAKTLPNSWVGWVKKLPFTIWGNMLRKSTFFSLHYNKKFKIIMMRDVSFIFFGQINSFVFFCF